MKVNEIAFLGDSFTWGEGLELYLDSPFWINQRNKRSIWEDLKPIQTEESINFRESNRFANIVSDYLSSDLIIDSNNGGFIGNITKYLSNFLKNNHKLSFVIIQFSSFVRNPIHYHLGSLFDKCECGRCKDFRPTLHSFYHLLNTIRKKYADCEILTNEDKFYLNWLDGEFDFESYKYKNNKHAFQDAFDYVNLMIDSYSYKHLNYLLNEYVRPLENRGIKVFYIDSWDIESAKILHDIPDIKENMIFLKKYNSSDFTQSYFEFENSFTHTRIHDEFPKTHNGHPTLIQHQYIAESIINQIENFDRKSIIKLL